MANVIKLRNGKNRTGSRNEHIKSGVLCFLEKRGRKESRYETAGKGLSKSEDHATL